VARAARFSSRVDVALFVVCVLASLIIIVLPIQMRDPIAESLRRTVVAPLVGMQRGANRWRIALDQSEQRMAVTDTQALRSFQAYALQRENDQLRKLMGLGRQLGWGFVPAEALHQTSQEVVVTTLTLTAGSQAGVQRYNAVVSAEGVLGLVQTVDPAISVAILFSHPDFRASAMTADGTAFGIVYPHLGSEDSRYLLELRGVPLRYDVKPGTLVLTSGLGGTFPKGIPIGTVVNQIKTPEVWTKTYLVQPAVNPTSVSAAMVMTAKRAAAGVEGVWKNVPAVDTAVRRIVAAGDSISRQDSAAASAARTMAAVDSARRAQMRVADSARADSARRGTLGSAPKRDTTARRGTGTGGTTVPGPSTARADTRPAATAPVATPRETPPQPVARQPRAAEDVFGPPLPETTRARADTSRARRDTTRARPPRPDTTRPPSPTPRDHQ
jgi:rod shape-determining protein MreC